MNSNYREVLTAVRAWVDENGDHQFDVWAPRWQLSDKVQGAMAAPRQMADLYAQQVLRALSVLVDEGVLVKVGIRNDARYMTPAERERQVKVAEEAGRQHAAKVERYRQLKLNLAGAHFLDISNSQLDVRLSLEDWERLYDTYLRDDGGS